MEKVLTFGRKIIMAKSVYNIVSLVNLTVGIVATLFSIFLLFTSQDFCFRIDEVKGCGIWTDARLNALILSLFWIFASIYYFLKKNKISIYLNSIIFLAIPILFIFIVKSL